MPRPKTKPELLDRSQENFKKLTDFIAQIPEKGKHQEFPPGTLNRNIRDVLAHLHHWHLLFLGWYKVGMSGQKPQMPAAGHTWKTTTILNSEIQKKYAATPLTNIEQDLHNSFLALQKIIKAHSEAELFEKKYYGWTGTTSLGAYLVSATSSHYDWGLKLIKKVTRN
ncbi:ClbS/DfsB family four-helix bundle protein [Sediminicola luteus]|uniref:DfsB family protein n=1 Tax=Sediminicola luteus TaxID=319238 RepID=A0A2A4G178_9FLAO|nr:ClbS/DfsB family four-helix bundle protein [Sediminicola luteus]PCE62729.1 hypothetical protein B7P33_15675 [Sediminicola luteus]